MRLPKTKDEQIEYLLKKSIEAVSLARQENKSGNHRYVDQYLVGMENRLQLVRSIMCTGKAIPTNKNSHRNE